MYSQFEEEAIILEYFGQTQGTLIDIGANDGITFSNSLKCIENGWQGILVEPTDIAFSKLELLHKNRPDIYCKNVAMSERNGFSKMIVNGSHYNTGDTGLLSRIVKQEMSIIPNDAYKWQKFLTVKTIDFTTLISDTPFKTFDLISIDIEGFDLEILKQIDLIKLKVRMLIVEYDGVSTSKFDIYCSQHNMNLYKKTVTNLIYTV